MRDRADFYPVYPPGLLGCDTRRLVVLLEHTRYLAATRKARIGPIYNGTHEAASVSEPCGHRPSIPHPPSAPALLGSSLQSAPRANPCRSSLTPVLKLETKGQPTCLPCRTLHVGTLIVGVEGACLCSCRHLQGLTSYLPPHPQGHKVSLRRQHLRLTQHMSADCPICN